MIRSPPASSLPAGASPSPNSAMRPSAKATQPRSITRSASTIRALPMTVSDPVEVIVNVSLQAAAANDVTSTIRSAIRCADLVVMDDGDHGDAGAFLLGDQVDHDRAVGGVERGGRLVQQQDRQIAR